MKILIAPGPFKESLSASAVATAIERGVKLAEPDATISKLPMCDGGSGFSQHVTAHAGGELVESQARNPLGEPISARYGLISVYGQRTAVIESAAVCGLALVPMHQRDPAVTSTVGVGDLIRDAVVNRGCTQVIVGCGDSATNDGGSGMAAALGVRYLDIYGNSVPAGGLALKQVHAIDHSRVDPRILAAKFRVACNVTSILCGAQGTSRVYGPQKGANPTLCDELDEALTNLAEKVESAVGLDTRYVPGGGAAGGLGSALYAFLGARLDFSMNVVREFIDLDAAIRDADLVISGEGAIDRGTASGKVVACVALASKKYGKPAVAFTGKIADSAHLCYYLGLDALYSISDGPMALAESVSRAAELLEGAAFRAMRTIRVGINAGRLQ